MKLAVIGLVFVAGVGVGVGVGASAGEQAPRLFAVELTRGPAWDAAKAANEQAGFTEHSANIRRLTESQALVIGARYSDKGLLIVRADDDAAARAHFAADPMIGKNVFRADVAVFSAFKNGCTDAPKRE